MHEHFFIIGAQRSSTTYLYHILDEHPEIEMARPIRPEPKVFLTGCGQSIDLIEYEARFFGQKPSARVLGEKSTSYLESPWAAQCISQHFPTAKLVVILRNPIERAILNYWFSFKNGFETLPIEQAFWEEKQRWFDYDNAQVSVSPFAYLRRGRYVEDILEYTKWFSDEQIYLMIQEESVGSLPEIQALYGYLNVEPNYVPPSWDRVINIGDRPRQSLPAELRAYLDEYFRESNRLLSQRFDLDLSVWINEE